MKKVSIIIPTYNGQKTIEETLKSVLTQIYQSYEIIIVDDGSKDSTLEIIKHIAPFAKVIQQKNQGTMAARQNGINSSSGELIAFLDQDDIWFNNHLDSAVNFLNSHPEYGLFVANMEAIDEKGNKLNFDVVPNSEKYSLTFESMLLIQPIATSTTVFHRKVVEEIGGLNTAYVFSGAMGDLDFFVRACEITHLHFENQVLGLYRWAETRPGRLLSFLENLRIYAKNFWYHPRVQSESERLLREKFIQACSQYSIYIWRLLLAQHSNKVSLDLLEKLNKHIIYMQNLFADNYEKLVGLRPIDTKNFLLENASVRIVLFLYLIRKDLQELYPLEQESNIIELLIKASKIAQEKNKDVDFETLKEYFTQLACLVRDSLKRDYDNFRNKNDALKLENDALKLENDALKLENNALKNNLSNLQTELELVYNSKSWRVTAPLRKVLAAALERRKKFYN